MENFNETMENVEEMIPEMIPDSVPVVPDSVPVAPVAVDAAMNAVPATTHNVGDTLLGLAAVGSMVYAGYRLAGAAKKGATWAWRKFKDRKKADQPATEATETKKETPAPTEEKKEENFDETSVEKEADQK